MLYARRLRKRSRKQRNARSRAVITMQPNILTAQQLVVSIALCFSAGLAQAPAQSQKPPSGQAQADDVIRVKTELVQTDVTVVDRQGRVVAGLKPEQFEL